MYLFAFRLLWFFPFFMVNSESLMSKGLEWVDPMKANWASSDNFCNLGLSFIWFIPVVHNGVLVFWHDLDSSITSQSVGWHADTNSRGGSHYNKQRIRRRVAQPALLEIVVVCILSEESTRIVSRRVLKDGRTRHKSADTTIQDSLTGMSLFLGPSTAVDASRRAAGATDRWIPFRRANMVTVLWLRCKVGRKGVVFCCRRYYESKRWSGVFLSVKVQCELQKHGKFAFRAGGGTSRTLLGQRMRTSWCDICWVCKI